MLNFKVVALILLVIIAENALARNFKTNSWDYGWSDEWAENPQWDEDWGDGGGWDDDNSDVWGGDYSDDWAFDWDSNHGNNWNSRWSKSTYPGFTDEDFYKYMVNYAKWYHTFKGAKEAFESMIPK